jgi:glycine cleavage system aminomethyltransferase T
MKMSGQTNKRLRGLVSPTGAALASGMRLFATDHDGREVGWITSAARSERLCKQIALGFVKRGWNVGGAALSAAHIGGTGGDAVAVQVVDLPFA